MYGIDFSKNLNNLLSVLSSFDYGGKCSIKKIYEKIFSVASMHHAKCTAEAACGFLISFAVQWDI